MAADEVELNLPSFPLFTAELFSAGISNPSFKKEGKGRFLDGMTRGTM